MEQKVPTTLQGLSSTSQYQDGDCQQLVNLRPQNGGLTPVTPRKITGTTDRNYDILFLHQNSGYKNWIGVVHNDNLSSIYYNILGEPKGIHKDFTIKIEGIEQTGNMLTLVTKRDLYYILYQNGEYHYLGAMPELPYVEFKTSTDLKSRTIDLRDIWGSYNPISNNKENRDKVITAMKAAVNKAIDDITNGYKDRNNVDDIPGTPALYDAHFVRYAFRMADGSLSKHSAPILIMPPRAVCENDSPGNASENYAERRGMKTGFLSSNKDEILIAPAFTTVYCYFLELLYDTSVISGNWKELIKSIDVFISAPLGLSSIERMRDFASAYTTSTSTSLISNNLIKPVDRIKLIDIEENANFYFIHSIPLNEKKIVGTLEEEKIFIPSKDSPFKKIEDVVFQEAMKDDPFSHHRMGATASYAYNQRLHLGNIETTLFNGFNPHMFACMNKNSDAEFGNYNGYSYGKMSLIDPFFRYMLETEINAGGRTYKMYTESSPRLFLSSYLSYPDTRATSMSIWISKAHNPLDPENKEWTRLKTFPLTKHKFLNLAYYLDKDLKPIMKEDDGENIKKDIHNLPEAVVYENKIKVSALSNPMIFPAANTYLTGNGDVISMASNAIRISEGQFGQFPLYVFTTQGVYSLEVGTDETVYSRSSPSSYVVPTSKVTIPMPSGVMFTTERGLSVINGQQINELPNQLFEHVTPLNIQLLDAMKGTIHELPRISFAQYINGAEHIAYNHYQNEVIVNKRGMGFSYVLNLTSNQYYQTTEKIDVIARNTFPQIIALGDRQLKDYQFPQLDENGKEVRVDVSFILRPLRFGTNNIKWLQKQQLRGTFYDASPLLFVSESGKDGVNFKAISGYAPNQRTDYAALTTRLMPGNKYNYFTFVFGATLSAESRITGLESVVQSEYKDKFMI